MLMPQCARMHVVVVFECALADVYRCVSVNQMVSLHACVAVSAARLILRGVGQGTRYTHHARAMCWRRRPLELHAAARSAMPLDARRAARR